MGLSLLVSACGSSSGSSAGSTTSAGSPQLTAALAFSRCMRAQGVSNFPDPDAQGQFPPFETGVSKQISAAADETCKHLLSHGGSAGTPQDRREKFAFALQVARCLGIDPNSAQFQSAQTACEKNARGES
jgi:hypothetical protein